MALLGATDSGPRGLECLNGTTSPAKVRNRETIAHEAGHVGALFWSHTRAAVILWATFPRLQGGFQGWDPGCNVRAGAVRSFPGELGGPAEPRDAAVADPGSPRRGVRVSLFYHVLFRVPGRSPARPPFGDPACWARPRLAQEACRLLTPEAPAVWVPRATRDLVYVWSEAQEGILSRPATGR